jgi:DUF1009 family protein
MRYGLIAGNGRFPILALQAARKSGMDVVVIAIKEEASKELETLASKVHWISLGALSKLIDICKKEDISQVMMCGQVKHAKIFSSIVPDWRLVKLLAAIDTKNTDALIGAVQKVLSDEGITLADSTLLLKELIATEGVLTRRKPSAEETRDLEYGRRIAAALSAHDIGQSVVIAERACVALEAMEGTDAVLRRAASLAEGKPLRLVKGSGRRRHLLFDVPVLGLQTIDVMVETGATAAAIDAGRTLLLDREQLIEKANQASISVVAYADTSQAK